MKQIALGSGVVLWALCLAVYLRDGGSLPFTPSMLKIDLPGVAALVVYQDADLAKLTQQQRDVISGHLWTDKIVAGNWRVLDADAEFTGESPFRAAYDRHPAELPWAVISGSGTQYEGAMPATAAEMAQLVEGAK